MIQSQTTCGIGRNSAGPLLKPGWYPFNILLMMIGFIFFWPLGLGMLAYNLWGHRLNDLKTEIKRQFERPTGWNSAYGSMRPSGNTAFDAYRAREFARLEEERAKLDAMRQEFDDYMESLRQARDQEEFDRFMENRRARSAKG